MKRKLTLHLISLLMLLSISVEIEAQITIGSSKPPAIGALLQLTQGDETSKGLGMPRVALTSSSDLFPMFAKEDGTATQEYADDKAGSKSIDQQHVGLLVYNVKSEGTSAGRLCPGLHVWDGAEWKPLKPYLAATEDEVLVSSELIDYTFLDPTNPSDPKWAEFGKNPSDYHLGVTKKLVDSRDGTNEEYYYTRYYVGYAKVKNTYHIIRNYSCDQNDNATSITPVEYEGELFDDGIWMNQNMRAKMMDPNRTVSFDTPLTLIEDINRVQDWAVAAWVNPNLNPTPKPNDDGLLYTWAAATNGKGGEDGKGGLGPNSGAEDEGGIKERGLPQGICPFGWHLPSDREWTTLENAIMLNTTIFSNMDANIGGPLLDYKSLKESATGNPQVRGTTHAIAMKSPTAITTLPTFGKSKLPDEGGLNLTYMGYGAAASGANGTLQYGRYAMQWTSSSSDKGSYFRQIYSVNGSSPQEEQVQRGTRDRYWMLSVRCAKDQDR